jgi:hypothetical protein
MLGLLNARVKSDKVSDKVFDKVFDEADDPDKVNCPKCIAAYQKEGVLDVRDAEEGG